MPSVSQARSLKPSQLSPGDLHKQLSLRIPVTDHSLAAQNNSLAAQKNSLAAPKNSPVAQKNNTVLREQWSQQPSNQQSAVEIILPKQGQAQLAMLLPLLCNWLKQAGWLMWISPSSQCKEFWKQLQAQASSPWSQQLMTLYSNADNSPGQLAEKAILSGNCHTLVMTADALAKQEKRRLTQLATNHQCQIIFLYYR